MPLISLRGQGPYNIDAKQLYVLPDSDIGTALQRRIVALQSSYPGIAVEAVGSEWRIAIPDKLRIGHDAAFAAFTRRFLAYVADTASLPARGTQFTRKIPGDDRGRRVEPRLSTSTQVRAPAKLY